MTRGPIFLKSSITVSRGRRGWTASGVGSMKRLKSTLCWPVADSMSSNVTGGAAVEGVCTAVEYGCVK